MQMSNKVNVSGKINKCRSMQMSISSSKDAGQYGCRHEGLAEVSAEVSSRIKGCRSMPTLMGRLGQGQGQYEDLVKSEF
jgi:hypothetical protein